MLHEELRLALEDNERLEQAIADRILDDPKHIRQRVSRDQEIANFLARIRDQSQRALRIYEHDEAALTQEVQNLGTADTFDQFYKHLESIKSYHQRYPNEPVENVERAYRKIEDGGRGFAGDVDAMFAGEEAFGRFFDLTTLHEEYLNLPGVKNTRKLTYLQYLDVFDHLAPPHDNISRQDKMTEAYFSYIGSLAEYLESFMRRTRPLEDLDKLFRTFDDEFEQMWSEDKVPGWESDVSGTNGGESNGPATEGAGEGTWCADCEKEFKNHNVYKAHLTGKKHIKNAKARRQQESGSDTGPVNPGLSAVKRLKERAVAEREHRVSRIMGSMSTIREDTRVNVERRAGMTDRERQQELDALYADDSAAGAGNRTGAEGDEEVEVKMDNKLKLPLAWDGKPIPFWLYKLHGLGVEFPCEICGNYVYMGRRAFDRHFTEARHVYGLKCLGITSTSLFREITGIQEAERLWEKIQRDKAQVDKKSEEVVEMEDQQGTVMSHKLWNDLSKAGLL